MPAVPAKHAWVLALGILTLGGAIAPPARADRYSLGRATIGPPPAETVRASHRAARASIAQGRSVPVALSSLQRGGAITPAAYQQDYSAFLAAKRSLGKLTGTRRTELGAVLANLQSLVATGQFTASRLPAMFLTLERNRHWWTTEPLLSSGERVSFPPSKLVWEYYPGQGIEIQWLGTFGEANGYYLSGHENANLRQLLSEAIPLAANRAGGLAWEYMFRFDGGAPPWTSGLSQGTALQVLSRAWSRFKEPAYLTAAQQALGVFEAAPRTGVKVKTPAGALYVEYSYAPSDRILNGFVQALVGLYDYASITKDPLGLQLFEVGDAEARAEVPRYDTGAWSMYDQFGESSLNYHELLTEFLQHLCERTRKGPPFSPVPAPTPTPTPSPTPGGSTSPTGSSSTGGASPMGATVARAASTRSSVARLAATGAVPISGDQIYCTTAQRFTTDLHTPPAVALLTKSLRGGTRAGVQVSLSKISTVGLTIRQGGSVVWRNSATVERGKPRLLWSTPASGGTFSVTVSATDLVGNFATANGTIVVSHR
jgi:D-glucuronyl C5-epimerase C-terminus